MTKLLNSKQAAEFLGLKVQTLHNWRHNRRNLNYVKIGRLCMYKITELERFIESSQVDVNGNK